MTNIDDLEFRIECIYEAIGAVEETDISSVEPKLIKDGRRIVFYQDWSGELSDAKLANFANSLIENISSLEYLLKKWADNNGYDKVKVDNVFQNSIALKIIHDLWNNKKHGYPPRGKSHSGLYPRVDKYNRIMRMSTSAGEGSFIGYTLNRQGVQKVIGDGNAKVIITGDILDRDGNKIGDLYETLLKAINDWEKVLAEFGVNISSD